MNQNQMKFAVLHKEIQDLLRSIESGCNGWPALLQIRKKSLSYMNLGARENSCGAVTITLYFFFGCNIWKQVF